MNKCTKNILYNAAVYVRISKEDGDKLESDSITNQKNLIRDYLEKMPDINICSERVDDGFSGVSFARPAFLAMMEDIKAGKINCVVVKDLSRLGRNYIETGRYIEKIFPFMGVRFIAVNDHYDSVNGKNQSEDFIIPFKNLINDSYSRDTSVKIRSHLEIKRKKGEYISPFATYGYLKSEENKNQLVIDSYAADIVRDIFKWKLEGINQAKIADKLNALGVLSPMEYKKSIGLNYNTSFKTNKKAKWSQASVGRILKNEIYIGITAQGKGSTPNYKIRERFEKPKEEWVRVANTHEPIIEEDIFYNVQKIMKFDTRSAPNKEEVYIFAGILVCGDCEQNMVRKIVPSGRKKYIYYVCSSYKIDKNCTTHNISYEKLESITLVTLKKHIDEIANIERILNFIDNLTTIKNNIKTLDIQLIKKQDEIQKYKNRKISIYDDFAEGILSKNEYIELKKVYTKKEEIATNELIKIKGEINCVLNSSNENNTWIGYFKKHQNIDSLTRNVLVNLVEKVRVYENNRIEIECKYQDEYEIVLKDTHAALIPLDKCSTDVKEVSEHGKDE